MDFSNIPALQPPPGVTSNFTHPVSRAAEIQITTSVFLPLMAGFVLLRLYTRTKVTRKFGADDYLSVISAICVTAYCGVLLYLVDGPLAKNGWDVPVSHLTISYMKCNFVAMPLYGLSALFVKTTLLVLYLRIFAPSLRARVMLYAGIVFVVLFYLATEIAHIIFYMPNGQASFHQIGADHHLMYLYHVNKVQGVVGALTDLYILSIPLHLVVRLHLPVARKIGVCSIFLTGIMACICAIVGAYYRFQGAKSSDTLWANIPAYTLGVVELNTGIICSCMPVIFVLFKPIIKTDAYRHISRYFYVRAPAVHPDVDGADGVAPNPQRLPDIPKATISGIRTFVRRIYRSTAIITLETDTDHTFDDGTSANDGYHAQLKESAATKC